MASRTRSHRRLVDVTLPDGRVVTADGYRLGLPVFWYGSAPEGLVTMRQLAAEGLRPGGADRIALLEWRRGRRIAFLYDIQQAQLKREMTPAKWTAVKAALAARRRCAICPNDREYTRAGLCSRCYEIAGPTTPGESPAWVA